jgi:hypothetical protein
MSGCSGLLGRLLVLGGMGLLGAFLGWYSPPRQAS